MHHNATYVTFTAGDTQMSELKNKCFKRFPWQFNTQPVSPRGWIGLDPEGHRGNTPIRQVIKNISYKTDASQVTGTRLEFRGIRVIRDQNLPLNPTYAMDSCIEIT